MSRLVLKCVCNYLVLSKICTSWKNHLCLVNSFRRTSKQSVRLYWCFDRIMIKGIASIKHLLAFPWSTLFSAKVTGRWKLRARRSNSSLAIYCLTTLFARECAQRVQLTLGNDGPLGSAKRATSRFLLCLSRVSLKAQQNQMQRNAPWPSDCSMRFRVCTSASSDIGIRK